MTIEFHEFDANGDLLLVLDPICDKHDEILSNNTDGMATPNESEEVQAADITHNSENHHLNTKGSQETAASLNTADAGTQNPMYRGLPTEVIAKARIHMLVSSKALMLASPVFKAMLHSGTFREGNELQNSGKLSLPLPEDRPEALRILLDLAHLRNRQVPRKVPFSLLVHLSILVDKYQMLELVEPYVPIWMNDSEIQLSLPRMSDALLLPWLSITWVFNLSDDFKHLTRILMQESLSEIIMDKYEGYDLPVPEVIVEKVREMRQGALSDAVLVIQDIIQKYQQPEIRCDTKHLGTDPKNRLALKYACDAQMLGVLMKSFASIGIWPAPLPPYPGMTWKNTELGILKLQIISACDMKYAQQPWTKPSGHKVMGLIADKMEAIGKLMNGLELASFKRSMTQ